MTPTLPPITFESAFKPEKPGAFLGLPSDDYHAAPGTSKSALDKLHRSPLDYQRWRANFLQDEPTEAMTGGRLLHALVLENRRDWTVKPETYGPENKKWNGNAGECRAWMDAHRDEIVISHAEAVLLEMQAVYVRTHPVAGPLLRDGLAEVSVFARREGTGQLMKGRLDYVRQNGDETQIIDLKRMNDATTRALSREISNRRYHVQAAMYRRLLQRLGVSGRISFILIALENGDAPKVNVRQLAETAIDIGEKALDADLDAQRRYAIDMRYPEFADSSDFVGSVDLPDWAYADEQPDEIQTTNAAA